MLTSAARLQDLVPDSVLVSGTAAALHARHRVSFDHGHVLTDLADRYAHVVAAVEASEGWVISVRASSPPLTLLGSLDGVEAGMRQLRRTRPLEVEEYVLPGGETVRAPSLEEMLRVKAYLVVHATRCGTTSTRWHWLLASARTNRCRSWLRSTATTRIGLMRAIRC